MSTWHFVDAAAVWQMVCVLAGKGIGPLPELQLPKAGRSSAARIDCLRRLHKPPPQLSGQTTPPSRHTTRPARPLEPCPSTTARTSRISLSPYNHASLPTAATHIPALSTPYLDHKAAQTQESTHHGRLHFQVLIIDLGEERDQNIDFGACKSYRCKYTWTGTDHLHRTMPVRRRCCTD